MTHSLSDALPLPQPNKATHNQTTDTDAARETTPGGQETVPWIEVAINLQPAEAMIIKGRLESWDIPAIIQQESIGSVMGLTIGPLGVARILVPETAVDAALSLLNDTDESEAE